MIEWLVGFIEESPLVTATMIDWADIALLSFILYRSLLFLRGTRAMQSLLGLALLGLGYVLADQIGLSATHWVFDNIFVWAVLAVVILFQDDIRRALARAGRTFYGRSARATEAQIYEEIIRACFSLARRKIGALIALERKAELAPYSEGAHRLDAQPTHGLIQSIFHPSSPLHDGAMLLIGSRLHSAGVFLPISLSKTVSRAYGTRHRAAIGLTEETDAICLVVSEERGTVSLVQDGQVVPVADANDLRQRLREGLERPDKDDVEETDEDEREVVDA